MFEKVPVKSTGIIQRVKGGKGGYNVEREPRASLASPL